MKRFAIYTTAACVLAGASIMPGATISTAPRGRVVEVIADKDNIFKISGQKKAIIYAKVGEPLHIKVISHRGGESARDGAVHSFVIKKLKDQGWDIRLMEGVQEFDVLAPAPGEYLVECTVKCGQGHEDVNMKLRDRHEITVPIVGWAILPAAGFSAGETRCKRAAARIGRPTQG
jgi:hypothetical protein